MARRKFKASLFDHRETPATLRIEDQYRRVGIIPGFRLSRVEKIARWVNCTIYELGRMAGLEFWETAEFIQKGRFPPCASIHFAVLESYHSHQQPVVPIQILKEQEEHGSSTDFEEARHDEGTAEEDLREAHVAATG